MGRATYLYLLITYLVLGSNAYSQRIVTTNTGTDGLYFVNLHNPSLSGTQTVDVTLTSLGHFTLSNGGAGSAGFQCSTNRTCANLPTYRSLAPGQSFQFSVMVTHAPPNTSNSGVVLTIKVAEDSGTVVAYAHAAGIPNNGAWGMIYVPINGGRPF